LTIGEQPNVNVDKQNSICGIVLLNSPMGIKLSLTFGGMWRCLRVEVARVFAVVIRCRIMLLLYDYRDGKNRDTRRECPAAAGPGRGASHKSFLFSYIIVAPRRGNDIYRPVSTSNLLII